MSFVVVSAASLAILVVVHGITFPIGRRIGRYNVVDVTWGIGFVAIAAVAAGVGTGDLFRRILLLVIVAVWGLRTP
jgi:steroid 5-alpha reductase family enzyme